MHTHRAQKAIPSYYLYFILLTLGFLAYAPALFNEFIILDDGLYVVENPVFNRQGWDFWQNLMFGNHGGNLDPVTMASHVIDLHLYGLNSLGHHASSLIWHLATGLLLFRVLFRLFKRRDLAWFASLIWMIHPLQVESVAWVSERKNLISTFFLLASLLAWLRFERTHLKRYWTFSFLLFVIGLFAKSMIVTLPCILVLLSLRRCHSGFSLRDVWSCCSPTFLRVLPFFGMSALISWLTVHYQANAGAMAFGMKYGLPTRLLNAIISYSTYIQQFLWPKDLVIMYPLSGQFHWFGAVPIAGFLCGAVFLWRKYQLKWVLIGFFFFLGTLVPVIGIVQVGLQSHADRYMYLPMIGLCLMFGDLPFRRIHLRPWFWLICLTALGLAYRTSQQTRTWRDTETLFKHAYTHTEKNWYALFILVRIDAGLGKFDDARKKQEEMAEWQVEPGLALYCKAMIEKKAGNFDLAESLFLQAMEFEPDFDRSLMDFADLALQAKNFKVARQRIERFLKLYPDNEGAWMLAGEIYEACNEPQLAEQAYQKAVNLLPVAEVFRLLSEFYKKQGSTEKAKFYYQKWLAAPRQDAL
ncbi:MAG: tetratricopeptide repeat protein [Acidobacteria bacterium]|nr:tetratricopeptide repeat protein [Acidobacteriota bacterium]MCB9397235.1 tetratricopeptide repeat protein [Acidobacteriota bacterium]